LTGLVLGYGYQPWWTLVCLLLVLAVAVVLAVALGGHRGSAGWGLQLLAWAFATLFITGFTGVARKT
jgi:ABC-type arginine/histidine transport system permease subunit